MNIVEDIKSVFFKELETGSYKEEIGILFKSESIVFIAFFAKSLPASNVSKDSSSCNAFSNLSLIVESRSIKRFARERLLLLLNMDLECKRARRSI